MSMEVNAILQMPLSQVMRPDIALQLQQLHAIQTVGGFLRHWRDPRGKQRIEQAFESATQARHAAAVCAAWLGYSSVYLPTAVPTWWRNDVDAAGPSRADA
jgi:hypothetical protein